VNESVADHKHICVCGGGAQMWFHTPSCCSSIRLSVFRFRHNTHPY